MPTFSSPTTTPEKDSVTVRPTKSYATLWSRITTDSITSHLAYYFLAPFFLLQICIMLLKNKHIVLLEDPEVLPVDVPSTTQNPPENPVAYTAENEYESVNQDISTRIGRLFTIAPHAFSLYLQHKPVAYLACTKPTPINSDEYLVTEDEDSFRPIVLFR